MVRLLHLSLLALTAFANHQVLSDPLTRLRIWSYTICGHADSQVVQIESIALFPDPPVPGEDLTVMVNGTVRETIENGAYADVTVKIGLVKLLTKEFDVCEEALIANASIRCPVEPGNHTVLQTVKLPREIPQAKFSVHIDGHTVDDKDLLCLDLKVDFRKSPFPGLW